MDIINIFSHSNSPIEMVDKENVKLLKIAPKYILSAKHFDSESPKKIQEKDFSFFFRKYNASTSLLDEVKKSYVFENTNNKKMHVDISSLFYLNEKEITNIHTGCYKCKTNDKTIIPFLMFLLEEDSKAFLLNDLFWNNYSVEDTPFYKEFTKQYAKKEQAKDCISFLEELMSNFKNKSKQVFNLKKLYKMGVFNNPKTSIKIFFWKNFLIDKNNNQNKIKIVINFNPNNTLIVKDSRIKTISLIFDEKVSEWIVYEIILTKFFGDSKHSITIKENEGKSIVKEYKKKICFNPLKSSYSDMMCSKGFKEIKIIQDDVFSLKVNKIKLPEIFKSFELPIEVDLQKESIDFFYNYKKPAKKFKKVFNEAIDNFEDDILLGAFKFLCLMPQSKLSKKIFKRINKIDIDWFENLNENMLKLLLISDESFEFLCDFYKQAKQSIEDIKDIHHKYSKKDFSDYNTNIKMSESLLVCLT